MGALDKLKHFYTKRYRELLIVPILMIVFSISVIGLNYYKHGDFIQKGISLKGGTAVTIQMDGVSAQAIEAGLRQSFSTGQISVREITSAGNVVGAIVDSSGADPDALVGEIKKLVGPEASLAVETIGDALGASFFRESIRALIFAFLFMAIVVLIYFRDFVPALYVILSAAVDILFAVALVDLFGIKVGTAGIAAFLMLIGYSVDTDILLTARVLKGKEGTVSERIIGSMKTGLTMTFAALAATLIAFFFTPSDVLKEIMIILFFGLVADIPSTWLMNAGLLRMHFERKHKGAHTR